ncbi:hypothetical protein JZ751_014046, partial [Albula glossodonta]
MKGRSAACHTDGMKGMPQEMQSFVIRFYRMSYSSRPRASARGPDGANEMHTLFTSIKSSVTAAQSCIRCKSSVLLQLQELRSSASTA